MAQLNSNITSAIIQADRAQDFTISGQGIDEETGRPFDWTIVADGHGTDNFINIIRSTDFNPYIGKSDPIASIVTYLKTFDGTYRIIPYNAHLLESFVNSGCTFILIKMYDNNFNGASRKIVGYSIGDSQFAFYLDGVREYISEPHNLNNPKEIERLKDRLGVKKVTEKDPVPVILSSTKLKGVPCIYNLFENKTRLAPTQAFGHDFITGIDPVVHTLEYLPSQQLKWIAASDGFWDMYIEEGDDHLTDERDICSMSAQELADKACNRWKQKWNYHWHYTKPEIFYETQYPSSNYDDIVVVTGTSSVILDVVVPVSLLPLVIANIVPVYPDSDYVAALLNGTILLSAV